MVVVEAFVKARPFKVKRNSCTVVYVFISKYVKGKIVQKWLKDYPNIKIKNFWEFFFFNLQPIYKVIPFGRNLFFKRNTQKYCTFLECYYTMLWNVKNSFFFALVSNFLQLCLSSERGKKSLTKIRLQIFQFQLFVIFLCIQLFS